MMDLIISFIICVQIYRVARRPVVTTSQLQGPRFNPDFGLLFVSRFASIPCLCAFPLSLFSGFLPPQIKTSRWTV